eukprot:Nk52_evm6s805 gene=Nk52_evmTU6s805
MPMNIDSAHADRGGKITPNVRIMTPAWQGGLAGGLSGMCAAAVTQPIDFLKTRLQLTGEGKARVETKKETPSLGKRIFTIYKREGGISSFYKGLSASLLRQMMYTTTRFTVYAKLKESFGEDLKGGRFQGLSKLLFAMPSGAIGALVGCPADVVLVRMQADGRLPVEQRRGYKNVFHGIQSIAKNEGIFTLWRGATPLVTRAVIVTCAQFVGYDTSKKFLTENYADSFGSECVKTHILSSLMAGGYTTVFAAPVDVIKTRMMNNQRVPINDLPGAPTKLVYNNMLDCFMNIARHEGPLGFYKGASAYFGRVAPHVVCMFVFYEQFMIAINRARVALDETSTSHHTIV